MHCHLVEIERRVGPLDVYVKAGPVLNIFVLLKRQLHLSHPTS